MEGRSELNEAFAALLEVSPDDSSTKGGKPPPARVLVAQSCIDDESVALIDSTFTVVADKQLQRSLRDGGWLAVVFAKLTTSLLRSIAEARPALVVCTGELSPDRLRQLREVQASHSGVCLGPVARLECRAQGHTLVIAPDRFERLALNRAFPRRRLSISPAPAWLFDGLGKLIDDEALCVVGMIDATVLVPTKGSVAADAGATETNAWCKWARGLDPDADRPHLVVPIGLPELDLDEPEAVALERTLTCHMLERFSGPVFPSPRVIAAIHRGHGRRHGDDQSAADEAPVSPSADALWAQAARALPRLGRRLQMERPLPDVSLEVPASTFLAQEALLRRSKVAAFRQRSAPALVELDEEHRERADQVLRASAQVLSEHESKVVLRGYGFEITRQAVASSASGAAQFADRIGYPVVLKALSPDLRRKSEIGAVRLDLANAASVRRAHGEILARVERDAPLAQLDGVVVAEMVGPGLEFRCGGLRRLGGGAAFYALPVVAGQSHEASLFPGPLRWHEAMELAYCAMQRLATPALRRAADPGVDQLAIVLLQLSRMFEHTGTRLRAVHLDPIRLLGDDARPYAVLDARIEQEAHLEGR